MPVTTPALVKSEADQLAGVAGDLPPELRASVARHQKQLVSLVENLIAVGMDEARIDEAVSSLIESYEYELRLALRNIGET